MSWSWILLIWLVGFGFLLLELLVPGVVLGILGFVMVAVAVVFMFVHHGGAAGAGLSVGSLILGGILLKLGISRLSHKHRLEEEGYVGTDDHSALIGKSGEAVTMLRPGGFATIGGRRVDVVTAGEHLPKGTAVVVTEVEGNRIEVRKAS